MSCLRNIVKLLPWELAHLGNNLPEPIWYSENPGFRVGLLASMILIGIYFIAVVVIPSQRAVHDVAAKTKVTLTTSELG